MNDWDIPLPVWEDLVQDFLEMACFLTEEERSYLIDQLQKKGVQSDSLQVFPSFAIDNRIIVICEEEKARECWIYFPKEKRIARSVLV